MLLPIVGLISVSQRDKFCGELKSIVPQRNGDKIEPQIKKFASIYVSDVINRSTYVGL